MSVINRLLKAKELLSSWLDAGNCSGNEEEVMDLFEAMRSEIEEDNKRYIEKEQFFNVMKECYGIMVDKLLQMESELRDIKIKKSREKGEKKKECKIYSIKRKKG